MSEAPASVTAKRRAMRLRKSNFRTPPRDWPQRQMSIMHPAFLPPWRESAAALLGAGLGVQPLDPAAEHRVDHAATEAGRSAPGRRPGET